MRLYKYNPWGKKNRIEYCFGDFPKGLPPKNNTEIQRPFKGFIFKTISSSGKKINPIRVEYITITFDCTVNVRETTIHQCKNEVVKGYIQSNQWLLDMGMDRAFYI